MKADPVAPARVRRAGLALAAGALAIVLAACASKDVVPHEMPPPPVTSVAQADQQLAEVARERAAIEARFVDRERLCYTKFFVNNCLDEAKEHRRAALVAQRAIEIQANHFKRQTVAEERDRNVAEAERKFAEQEAKLAAEPPKPAPEVKPEPAARTALAPQRQAEHNARLKTEQNQAAADAAKRAQNVHDYEQRKADSAERQRNVAKRKADRAAKAAKDAADAKAKAAQDAAAAQQAAQSK